MAFVLNPVIGNQKMNNNAVFEGHLQWRHHLNVYEWSGCPLVFESAWFFQFIMAWKVTESQRGPWKILNLYLEFRTWSYMLADRHMN